MKRYIQNNAEESKERNYWVTDLVLAVVGGGVITLGFVFMLHMLLLAGNN